MSGLMQTPCVIVRRTDHGAIDDYGDAILTESLVEAICDLQQQSRTETNGVVTTSWVIFFPIGTEVDSGDSILVKDVEYEVEGDPWEADQGSEAVNHVVATLRRAAGVEQVS
jgi:hypothetical protein